MGFYINTTSYGETLPPIGKINELIKSGDATEILCPEKFPTEYAVICVMDNVMFEAAGFCYNEREFNEFKEPDGRRKRWLKMDLQLAKELSGYKE